MEPRQRLSVLLTLGVIAFALWRYTADAGPGVEGRHLGAWTDPAGVPGNRLTFALEWKDLPGSPLSAGEGVFTARRWLGQEELTGCWNFENLSGPLRLNVVTRARSYVVPVESLADGRLCLAFHEDAGRAYGPDALSGPAAKVLVPVKDKLAARK